MIVNGKDADTRSRRIGRGCRQSDALLASFLVAIILSGCECARPLPAVTLAEGECPPDLQNHLKLSAAAAPTTIPADLAASEDAVQRYGLRGRRLTVSVLPDDEALRGVGTLSSTLTISVLGGTFLGWARMDENDSHDRDASRVAQPTPPELRAIDVTPGRIRVTPFLQRPRLQAQTSWLDVLVMPGGVPVDALAVHMGQLWTADGHPVAPEMAQVALTQIEHLSILDVVQAAVDLKYRVRRSVFSHHEWQCSAHANLTLVDHDAVRPPLWDLGVPSPDSYGRRAWWLALVDSKTGPFRVIFTSPAEAHGFATWLLQTGATRVGPYNLALVQPKPADDEKTILPVDWSVVERSRAVTGSDLREVRAGRIGEP